MKKINTFQMMLVVFMLISTMAMGQWTNVPTTGIENTCNVTRVFADGTDLYAYVSGSGMYKSTDNGDTWSIFNLNLPAGVAITAFTATPTKIYVAADKNGIYGSDKATAGFTKLGNVPVISNSFTGLESIKDTLYLGINGKGVYKCVIPTATYTQLTSGLANNAVVMTLTTDSITGVGRRLYAGVAGDNGFYVKNKNNDTWVQVLLSSETVATSKGQVRSLYASGGKVVAGGTTSTRGLIYYGTTTDFVTYSFAKVETGLPLDQQINAVVQDGNTIYAANTRSVWKSTDVTQPNITFSQVASGLQSQRASTPHLIMSASLWASQATGGYMSSNGGTSWTRKLNLPVSPAIINGFKEYAGKLYANTSSGIYVSATGDGSDWAKFGTGINGNVGQFGLSFGDLGTFATLDGALFKLNGNNWEPVNITIGPRRFNHPMYGAIVDIEQFNNGTKTCLFGSGFRSVGIYRYDGTAWDLYSTVTPTENSIGLFQEANGVSDSLQRCIGTKFMYDLTENRLFCFGKNRVQISKDFGNSWIWRIGVANTTGLVADGYYTSNQTNFNIRSAALKTVDAQKFLYIGTDVQSANNWSIARTEYAPDATDKVGTVWSLGSLSVGVSETKDIISFENTPIMIFRGTTSAGVTTSVSVSKDNGTTGKLFQTGITTLANISCLGRYGDYVYLGTKTNEMQRYNAKAIPAFTGDAPAVTTIAATTASLEATASVPATIYTVVVLKNAAAPSVAQIVAGKDAADATALSPVNAVATANVKATISLTGFSENTDYKLYTVAISETGVASTVTSIDFKTTLNTGLDNVKMVSSIYPVPAKGLLNVTMAVDANVSITNLLGARLVATQGKAGETLKIDVSGLQSGIYLVETNNGKNKRIEKITIK